jgi:O-antigen/teichoic acid export membrane protein
MRDLKLKTLRGGMARLSAQVVSFVVRILSLVVLSRMLSPKDFGLVGMVTAFTGILAMFRDFGLSTASIQSETITDEQKSTLFWINLAFGAALAALTLAAAPAIAAFYHERRLVGVAAVLAIGVFLNGAGVQHAALLSRQMRFTALAVINTGSLLLGTTIGIGAAWAGLGYWSLVIMSTIAPLVSTIGFWITASWIPKLPRRRTGVHSMVRMGGAVTLNGFLTYVATNFEKILLGRYWGAYAIGVYGRAYQLSNIPTDNLNSAVSEVAFAALSRIQNDPPRLKSYFLKGYSLIVSLTLPITIASALFAPDIVLTVMGPKWKDAVPIFRLLAPTILVFAVANPLSWFLYSIGKVGRLTKMTMVISPIMMASFLLAVPHGPTGVAFTYSLVMLLWVIPTVFWATRGTPVTPKDILQAVKSPLISGLVAGGLAFAAHSVYARGMSSFLRLILEGAVMVAAYAGMLFFVVGQKGFYLDLLRTITGSRSAKSANEEESMASV